MEETHMGNSSRQSGKAQSITEGKEGTEIELAVTGVSNHINIEIFLIQNRGNVIDLASGVESV